MSSGQYPGLMVSQEGNENLAYGRGAYMALWKSLWKFEGYIKVGLIDAHQNSLPALESDGKSTNRYPHVLL